MRDLLLKLVGIMIGLSLLEKGLDYFFGNIDGVVRVYYFGKFVLIIQAMILCLIILLFTREGVRRIEEKAYR